ncbi:uncharacterized protein K460DRAFT_366687 [Cucurbitaria berberidis CBS 394.84]|uniref:Prolyl 4-hydroxylase alpha subunit domain-containing protein n=1 Tax=Cucurbitaria berberidis CBS 394.84 TaxID=1168544 RepID=A0A9P4GI43_9PLEO|nr:uncharacterized protein K460DRAFT_366687 [Cucurbitaria berberidis CBS 394.84]KAF1845836.1 hypothetical protein K460DRAFT_366687 [Cucurbitaria berberidis CBS 394.84]
MPSSSLFPFSFLSLVQYAFLGVILYILAGAPLLSLVDLSGSSYSYSTSASGGSNAGGGGIVGEKLDTLVIPEANLTCQAHSYKGVYVLSREPLVVYIEGFVSAEECERVVRVSEPHFTPSTVWNAGQERLDTTVRHSEKTLTPRDHTVKCIEERARTFQGWRPYTFVEKLWTQRYGAGGHYTYHFDWNTATRTSGRVSSFMVYLEANCTGGGTHFPRLQKPIEKSWCKFIECGEQAGPNVGRGSEGPSLSEGVIFRPIKGNAVYWENMRSGGEGYLETWHAGLPVTNGTKIGLNIWSWFQAGYVPPVQ